jgi:hypothetical protein
MPSADRVSNEKKNLNRLAGEFLVASRLAQRGYMVSLQWGNTISYDILAFDKLGKVRFHRGQINCFISSPLGPSKQVRNTKR